MLGQYKPWYDGKPTSLRYGMTSISSLRDAFSLAAFMAAQSDGAVLDFTDSSLLFQENTGFTPADDAGESIGLAFDARTWSGKSLDQILDEQTNLAQGDATAGVVVGVVGSGGALPTGWETTAGDVGLSTEVMAVGADYVDIKFSGTASSSWRLRFMPTRSVAVIPGKRYVSDIDAALIAGSLSVKQFGPLWFNAANAFDSAELVNISPSGSLQSFRTSARVPPTAVKGHTEFFSGTTGAINVTMRFSLPKFRLAPGNHARQPTGTLKPKVQLTGARFDGVDDYLATDYKLTGASHFVIVKAAIPASIPSPQYLVAADDGAGGNRFRIAIGTDGTLVFGLGDSSGVAAFTTDWRGQTVTLGVTFDGSNWRVFEQDAQSGTGAQSGAPTTTYPLFIGARNGSGSPSAYFAGDVDTLLLGREYIDEATFLKNASKL